LSKLPVRYWEPEREVVNEFGKRLNEWGAMWREGIGRAVGARERRVSSARS